MARRTTQALLAAAIVAGVFAGEAPSLRAQVLERPPRSTERRRSTEGVFGGGRDTINPNQTRSELVLTLDASGGWDDNLAPEGTGISTNPFGQPESGYAGVGSASLRYWRGRTARAFETIGRGFVNSYSDLGVGTVAGGDFTLQGQTELMGRSRLTAISEIHYQPTLVLGAFGPIEGQVDSGVAASADPSRGVTNYRSLTGAASLDFSHQWSARQRTVARYDFARHAFLDGAPLDSRQNTESVRHIWDFARAVGLNLSYRHSDQVMDQPTGGSRGLGTDAAEVGFELRKAMSSTRRITVSAGAGAAQVRTANAITGVPFDYTAPSGYSSARFDLGRTWALSGDYRRAVNVLEGLTNESFFTDSAAMTLGGGLGRRVGVAVSGAFAYGSAQGSDTGRYQSMTGTAQIQYALSRRCSLVTSYSYYQHRLEDVSAIVPGYPARFERNSLRTGITVRLPLYGAFQQPADRARTPNRRRR